MRPSLLTRVRWRLEDLRHVDDAQVIAGLLAAAALTAGGFLAARVATRGSTGSAAATRKITLRQEVRVHEHGHIVTHWRVRRLYSRAQTVLRTRTVSTPNGIRLVKRPVTRYRRVYRDRSAAPTKTVTVTRPVTVARPVTGSNPVTVTQPVTVVETTTAIATVTDTLPITITVTMP